MFARTGLAVFASMLFTTIAVAQIGDFQSGGDGPDMVLSAQLAIKGPTTTVCPNEATVTGWVFTNYAGPLQVMIAGRGQGVGAPMTIEAKPAANGQFMATYSRKIQIIAPIDTEYRMLVGGGSGVMSNWAPLKATCGVGMTGDELGG